MSKTKEFDRIASKCAEEIIKDILYAIFFFIVGWLTANTWIFIQTC